MWLQVTQAALGGERFPQFLPDGRQFVYWDESEGIKIGSLDSPDTKLLTAAESSAVFLPPDYLLFVRQGSLVAQRFDLAQGELLGDPTRITDEVIVDVLGRGAFSASARGMVAYRPGSASGVQLSWFDRTGNSVGSLGGEGSGFAAPVILT